MSQGLNEHGDWMILTLLEVSLPVSQLKYVGGELWGSVYCCCPGCSFHGETLGMSAEHLSGSLNSYQNKAPELLCGNIQQPKLSKLFLLSATVNIHRWLQDAVDTPASHWKIYVRPLGERGICCRLCFQLYADEIQLCISFFIEALNILTKMTPEILEISTWMTSTWLRLILGKNKMILVGRGKCFEELAAHWPPVLYPVNSSFSKWCKAFRFCLTLSLSLRSGTIHGKSAFFHLHLPRKLHHSLLDEELARLIHMCVTSRLHNCN